MLYILLYCYIYFYIYKYCYIYCYIYCYTYYYAILYNVMLLYTVYTVHCTLYSVQCTLYTLYNVILYSVQYNVILLYTYKNETLAVIAHLHMHVMYNSKWPLLMRLLMYCTLHLLTNTLYK